MGLLKKCAKCEAYTFSSACPKCEGSTDAPHPPRFSPEDKYWKQRLIARGVIKC
ncbi:MAG: RNA-protein complex protein Nop10 [Candidatus Altiarchaeota archaeon]|nr:RNA-protein complex protein Nop10 [Candidatus Altiarchaeota archaeon]